VLCGRGKGEEEVELEALLTAEMAGAVAAGIGVTSGRLGWEGSNHHHFNCCKVNCINIYITKLVSLSAR
jgi:hypothetical protein